MDCFLSKLRSWQMIWGLSCRLFHSDYRLAHGKAAVKHRTLMPADKLKRLLVSDERLLSPGWLLVQSPANPTTPHDWHDVLVGDGPTSQSLLKGNINAKGAPAMATRLLVLSVLSLVLLACTTETPGSPSPAPTDSDVRHIPYWQTVPTEVWLRETSPLGWDAHQYEIVETLTALPPATPTPAPPPGLEFDSELTGGVQAMVACAGRTEAYWLEHGPPRLDAALVDCINSYMEVSLR